MNLAADPSGVAFTGPEDGDMRGNSAARRRVSDHLGIAPDWASVDQVHGARALAVERPGTAGPADGMVTSVPGLPLAIFTADCLGVVLTGPGAVGVAHAGWRGLSAGILESTTELMSRLGSPAVRAHIGPGIGPCCFEVGGEVADRFPEEISTTTWGTTSVDLLEAASRLLGAIDVSADRRCTACQGGPSHRRDATTTRMAALGWVV